VDSLGHWSLLWLGLGLAGAATLAGPLDLYSHCLYAANSLLSSHCLYMTEKRLKTAQVNLRIAPALKNAAEKAAADDQRSFTSLIEKLLTEYLRKKGYLTK
jgi:hypothetical protein